MKKVGQSQKLAQHQRINELEAIRVSTLSLAKRLYLVMLSEQIAAINQTNQTNGIENNELWKEYIVLIAVSEQIGFSLKQRQAKMPR